MTRLQQRLIACVGSDFVCSGQFYLGYSEAEMTGRSWYEFLHPDDLAQCAFQHMRGA